MQHNFDEVFDTTSPYWQKVLDIFAKNEKYEKKIVSNRNLHHKFPRSFSKMLNEPVDNDKDNLISLSLSDHFLIHYYYYLLAKKGFRQRMATAFTFMAKKGLKFMTPDTAEAMARDYDEARTIANQSHSEVMTGRTLSDEHKQKISESNKGKNKGKVLSPERRMQISESNRERVLSEETKRKISDSEKGRIISDETKSKISQSKKGQHKGMHWKLVDGKRVWY